jgi:hypothetical protein
MRTALAGASNVADPDIVQRHVQKTNPYQHQSEKPSPDAELHQSQKLGVVEH